MKVYVVIETDPDTVDVPFVAATEEEAVQYCFRRDFGRMESPDRGWGDALHVFVETNEDEEMLWEEMHYLVVHEREVGKESR